MAEACGHVAGSCPHHRDGGSHAPAAAGGTAGAAAGPRGARLVLAAVGVFLAPLGMAVVGAAVVSGDAGRQGLGALAGLAVGVLAAGLIGRWARPSLRRRRSAGLQGSEETCRPTACPEGEEAR